MCSLSKPMQSLQAEWSCVTLDLPQKVRRPCKQILFLRRYSWVTNIFVAMCVSWCACADEISVASFFFRIMVLLGGASRAGNVYEI